MIVAGIIAAARERNASDVHVDPDHGVAFRVFTRVERHAHAAVTPQDVAAFVDATLDRRCRARLDKLGIADAVYADDRVGSIRIHASRGKHGTRLAIRLLARSIPELSSLGLPSAVDAFCTLGSGLLLLSGPPGSGKSTTAAAILDRINATAQKHIVSFEDPPEFFHGWLRSIVTQYEVGRDVPSYADGVRGALRADPDVLFIGELRGIDTVSACLHASEAGHLVIAALHTPSETAHAINRLVGLFPADERESARLRVADALRAMLGLRLLPLRDGSGMRAAAEVVIANDAVRRLIRDGAVHQLRNVVSSARGDGMQTLEAHLSELVASGEVAVEEARAASLYPGDIVEPAGMRYRARR